LEEKSRVTHIKVFSIPFLPIVKEILYKSSKRLETELLLNGKSCGVGEVSKRTAKALGDNGYTMVKKPREKTEPKNIVFGIHVKTSREVGKNDETKEYTVTIKGSSEEDITEKRNMFVKCLQQLVPEVQIREQLKDKFMECGK